MKYVTFFLLGLYLCGCSLISFEDETLFRVNPSKDYQIIQEGEDISIIFSEDVNQYTAEQIISIKDISGRLDCRMLWENNRQLLIQPVDLLIPGIRYTLEFTGFYDSSNGRSRETNTITPFFYKSNTYLPLQVLSMTPAAGSTVGDSTPLVLTFNREPDESSLRKYLSLSPDKEFNYTLNENILTILPDENWENLTNYTITLSKKLTDSEGIPLDPEWEQSFYVAAGSIVPEITNVGSAVKDPPADYPYKTVNEELLEYNDALRIRFSEEMERDSVEGAFSLAPSLTGDLHWAENEYLIFVPDEGWVMDTEYTLRISRKALSNNGIALMEDYQLVFIPNIEVLSLDSLECVTNNEFTLTEYSSENPVDLPTNVVSPYDIVFRLNFSSPFGSDREKQSVQNQISIYEVFSSNGSPRGAAYSWSNDYTLTILFSGFNAAADREHYYVLELKGEATGVRNDQGSFLPETIQQLFRSLL